MFIVSNLKKTKRFSNSSSKMHTKRITKSDYCIISNAASSGSLVYLEKALTEIQKTPGKNLSTLLNFALHIACCGGWITMCKWLIKCGADPNHIDRDYTTPLYWILVGDNYKYEEEYEKLLVYMISQGMELNPVQIRKSRNCKNNRFEKLKHVIVESVAKKNAAIKIQRQLRKSMYVPKYTLCQNIMKRMYNNIEYEMIVGTYVNDYNKIQRMNINFD